MSSDRLIQVTCRKYRHILRLGTNDLVTLFVCAIPFYCTNDYLMDYCLENCKRLPINVSFEGWMAVFDCYI